MKQYKTQLLLLLLAAVLITLFSCCSWIYPLQPYDDANVFMSIGKSMLSGKLLYTDVHDQKGPLLFFLHEWAAALSSKTFFGIYLLEIACCFGFLACSYRTICMFAAHGISLVTTCMVGVLTYTSDFMVYGDSVEELSLPILLYVLYKTLRYAKCGELPKVWESVLLGIGIAAIFWMKFTVLAMCVGALVALFILAWRRSQMSLLLQCLTWVIAGAGGLTAGILLYFAIHGNEADLYHSYFFFNIFLYTDAGKVDASEGWWPVKWAGWVLVMWAVLYSRVSRDIKLAVAACLGAELLPFVVLKVYLYYFLTIFAFAPLCIYFVRNIRSRAVLAVGAMTLSLFAVATNYNLMTLLMGNFPQAVLHLAETVNADKDPGKQVLTVNSYDTGIYALTDCLPPVKFFFTPNTYTEELVIEQEEYLKSCQAKYVIQRSKGSLYYSSFQPDLTRDYILVQEASDAYRTEFILHPLQFLWSLGYMNRVIEHFHTPEQQIVTYRLYRSKHLDTTEHNSQAIIGNWKMCAEKSRCFTLSFTKYGLVRYKEFADGRLKQDKTYSYTYQRGKLKLGYMFTGEEYQTIEIASLSATQLAIRRWPQRGKNIFSKTK